MAKRLGLAFRETRGDAESMSRRDLRAPSTFYSEPFSLILGAVAMRDDGAALVVGATSSYNWISGAVLRTIP